MIRHAIADDIEKSIEIGIEFINSGYYSNLPIDIPMMREHATRALDDPNWLYLVDEIEGNQVGFFSAKLEYTMFGKGIVAIQDLMFIKPEYRTGMSALKFLRKFEEWATENEAMQLNFSPSVHVDDRFDKLAKKAGYEYIGPQYGKKI